MCIRFTSTDDVYFIPKTAIVAFVWDKSALFAPADHLFAKASVF